MFRRTKGAAHGWSNVCVPVFFCACSISLMAFSFSHKATLHQKIEISSPCAPHCDIYCFTARVVFSSQLLLFRTHKACNGCQYQPHRNNNITWYNDFIYECENKTIISRQSSRAFDHKTICTDVIYVCLFACVCDAINKTISVVTRVAAYNLFKTNKLQKKPVEISYFSFRVQSFINI